MKKAWILFCGAMSLAWLSVASGCAGNAARPASDARSADVSIRIRWPDGDASGRFLHRVADTVRIRVVSGATVIAQAETRHPDVLVTLERLPLYPIDFEVEAFQKANGIVLSRTRLEDVLLHPGPGNDLTFTLASQVDRIVVPAPSLTLKPGEARSLSATALDSVGAAVLSPVPSGFLRWESSAPSVASVDPQTGRLVAGVRGTAQITVVEDGEPRGKAKSARVMVYVDSQGVFGAGDWKGTYTWRPPAGPNSPMPLNQMWILFKSDNTVQAIFMGNRHMVGHWSGQSVLGCNFTMTGGPLVQGNVGADGKTVTGTFTYANGSVADFRVTGVAQDGGKNLLVNGSFEQNLAGWTLSTPHYLRTISLGQFGYTSAVAPHGVKVLTFNGAQEPPGSWLRQSVSTVPNAVYRLSFAFGKWGTPGPAQKLWVQSLDGNVVLDDQTFVKTDGAVTVGNPSGVGLFSYGLGMWIHPESASTAIAFTDAGSATIDTDGLLDDVRLELQELTLF